MRVLQSLFELLFFSVCCSFVMSSAFEEILREKLKDFIVDNEGQFRGYCETQEEIDVLLTQLKCIGYSYSVRRSTQQPKYSDGERSNRFGLAIVMQNIAPVFRTFFFGALLTDDSLLGLITRLIISTP